MSIDSGNRTPTTFPGDNLSGTTTKLTGRKYPLQLTDNLDPFRCSDVLGCLAWAVIDLGIR